MKHYNYEYQDLRSPFAGEVCNLASGVRVLHRYSSEIAFMVKPKNKETFSFPR